MGILAKNGLIGNRIFMISAFCGMQKQPPALFYKENRSEKFCNINSKAPVLGSLFNKA